MEGVGGVLEAGANIIGAAAKVTEGTNKVIGAGAQIAQTASAGIGETTSLAAPITEGIAQTANTGLLGGLQIGNIATQEATSGIGIGTESLGALPPPPSGGIDALKEAPIIQPDLGPSLSPGEQAADKAIEFGQANREYTEGLRSGNVDPNDAQRISQLRDEIDALRLQQIKQSGRSREREEEKKDEEWEIVRRGNKVVIRKKKGGLKRAVGDAAANLAADVANDVGKKS